MISGKKINKKGFTLVELLVVVSIIGILAAVTMTSFKSAQIKARDAQRKSDLQEVSHALMVYFNDNGNFPNLTSVGLFDQPTGLVSNDGKTVYMRKTPRDPVNRQAYTYQYVLGTGATSFKLLANLENKDDSQCNGGHSVNGIGYTFCYGISSPNITVGWTLF